MLLSPYFGRIDFLEDGEELAEKCYIGISNLISDDYNFLIYDWRAPISSMFYDYEIGDASYTCPEGLISGKLTTKRQYKIENGKIEYMFDSNLKIDDEILQSILGKSSDSKMKAIVTTIQREQNKVIRNDSYKNLIVQGPAGSGKTSIALHRIAYLLYKYRNKITPKNIVIFSPNNIFNEYISNVLPQLGEENMRQTTFKDYMHEALGDELQKEDYCDMMEYLLNAKHENTYLIRIDSIKFKSSMKFIEVLKEFVAYLETANKDFKDIIIRDQLVISANEIQELYSKDYIRLPLKNKLQKIRERLLFLLEPYEKRMIEEKIAELEESGDYVDRREIIERSKASVKEEISAITYEIDRMTRFNLVDSYKAFYRNLEIFLERVEAKYDHEKISQIKNYTLENLRAGRLDYEDQIALLYLKNAIGDRPKTPEIKYVIIDEAQDYTPLQYEIFHQLFEQANKTILGDIYQSINPFMNVGDYSHITHIFEKDNTCVLNLTKSYRSTMEITQFARRILSNKVTDEYVERRGEEPKIIGCLDHESIRKRILEDIKSYKNKGYKSIGIITKTTREAKAVYDALKDSTRVRKIVSDEDEYVNDTVIIPAYLAKGLEFDVVILYNAGEIVYSGDEDRLLLYTACTRALHALCLYYLGDLSPLLKETIV
ncbi:MAG: AAA family ATPase, partial [Candidatus Niameybacter stercoravium]|nr:AAA family ATPase [Candidatus Niameybacter stercoravium]